MVENEPLSTPKKTSTGESYTKQWANEDEDEEEEDESDLQPRAFLPCSVMRLDELFKTPHRAGFWPYSIDDVEHIRQTLPPISADRAIDAAILAVRVFFAAARVRQKHKAPPKANPKAELTRIQEAVAALKDAIKSASKQATQHLVDHPSPGASEPPLYPLDLLYLIERYEHDNRFALRKLPKCDMIGAPKNVSEENLICRLFDAWVQAHAGEAPTRGWPKFRAACIRPLLGAPIPKEFRLTDRTERAWQTALKQARERRKGEGKSPD